MVWCGSWRWQEPRRRAQGADPSPRPTWQVRVPKDIAYPRHLRPEHFSSRIVAASRRRFLRNNPGCPSIAGKRPPTRRTRGAHRVTMRPLPRTGSLRMPRRLWLFWADRVPPAMNARWSSRRGCQSTRHQRQGCRAMRNRRQSPGRGWRGHHRRPVPREIVSPRSRRRTAPPGARPSPRRERADRPPSRREPQARIRGQRASLRASRFPPESLPRKGAQNFRGECLGRFDRGRARKPCVRRAIKSRQSSRFGGSPHPRSPLTPCGTAERHPWLCR